MKREWFLRIENECRNRVIYARSQIDAACIIGPCGERGEYLMKAAAELIKAAHDMKLMAKNKVTP